MTTTELLLALAGATYLGVGAVCASKWFHHKDPISGVLVALFWPLSWFVK
jgi:hypothetical protein